MSNANSLLAEQNASNKPSVLKGMLFFMMALVLLNQYAGFIQPRALLLPYSLDENQVSYMLSKPGSWNLDHAVDSFHTYGPLYRHFKYSVGPNSEGSFLWLKLLPFFVTISIVFLALHKRSMFSIGCALVVVSLLRFPFFHSVPILFWIWTLAYRDAQSHKRNVLLGLWIFYVAFLFNYKFSWAVAGVLQLSVAIFCFSKDGKEGIKRFVTVGACCTGIAILMYGGATGHGLTILDYLRFSLADTSSYSESMVLMQSRDWASSKLYPLWVMMFLAVGMIYAPKWRSILFCATPILFVLFKYAWVRSDYDNARIFICYVPMMTGWLLLCSEKSWRVWLIHTIFFSGTFMMSSEMMSKATYPLFATRSFHLPLLLNYDERFEQEKAKSVSAFEEQCADFADVPEEIKHEPLLSLPIITHIAMLSQQPMVLPSNQYFYRFNDDVLVNRDIERLHLDKPNIIFHDESLHDQPPMAYGYKFFFEMLKHTEASQLHDATYLFQHHDRSLFWDQGSPDVELDSTGVERVFRFRTSKNAVLMLRSPDLKTVWYPLKRFLLKGDRVRFLHRQGSYERAYEAPIAMFDKGVTLTNDLTLLENHQAEGEHEIVIQGFLSDLHPYDFSYDVSALNENFDLEVDAFLLKPKH